LAEPVAGRRMADAGASIDIVIAEALPHQLLDKIGLLIRTAGRGDPADRTAPILLLDAAKLAGRIGDRLVPAHFAPGISDFLAHHRSEDPVLMRGIAEGEAALDAAVAVIGLPALIGQHPDDLVALYLRLEGTADPTIAAGRNDGPLRPAL